MASNSHTHTNAHEYLAITLLEQKIQHMCDIISMGFVFGLGSLWLWVWGGVGSQRNIMLLTILAFSPFTYILIISQDAFSVDYEQTHVCACVPEGCKCNWSAWLGDVVIFTFAFPANLLKCF